MLRYNRDKISKLIFEMRKALNRLDSIGKIEKEAFLNGPDKIDHRYLQSYNIPEWI